MAARLDLGYGHGSEASTRSGAERADPSLDRQGPGVTEAASGHQAPAGASDLSNATAMAVMRGEAGPQEMAAWIATYGPSMGLEGLDPMRSNQDMQRLMTLDPTTLGPSMGDGITQVLEAMSGAEVPPALNEALATRLDTAQPSEIGAEPVASGQMSPEEDESGDGMRAPTLEPQGPELKVDGAASASGNAPAETPTPASAPLAAPDELVDHYMEVNWDPSEYHAKKASLGLSSHIDTMIDHVVPQVAGVEVRSAVNLASSIASGALDAAVIGALKTVPVAGSIVHIGTFVQDVVHTHQDYTADGVDWIGMGLNQIRNLADGVGSVAGNLGDGISTAQTMVNGVPYIGQFVSGILAGIGTSTRSIPVFTNSVKACCSTLSVLHNVMEARNAEAQGQFRTAARLRELAHSGAITMLTDYAAVLSASASAATVNFIPGGAGEDASEAVGELVKLQRAMLSGSLGIKGGSGGIDYVGTAAGVISRGKGGGVLMLTQGYDNLMAKIQLGDAMKRSADGLFGSDYVSPSPLSAGGEVGSILTRARQGSIAHFEAVNGALEATPDPLWTQQILLEHLEPGKGSWVDIMDAAFSPSTILKGIWQADAWIRTTLDDGEKMEDAASYRRLAMILQTLGVPLFDQLQELIETHKPALDQVLLNFSTSLAEQEDVVQGIRDGLRSAEDYLQAVRELGDTRAQLDDLTAQVAGLLSDSGLTVDRFEAPTGIPEALWRPLILRLQAMVEQGVEQVEEAASQAAEGIDTFVDAQLERGETYLSDMQAALAEGGEVQQLLRAGQAALVLAVEKVAEAFQQWKPEVKDAIPLAVDWLNARAQQLQAATSAGRTEAFHDFLRVEARQEVERWRDAHGEKVEAVYTPEIPEAEVQAVEQAHQLINQRRADLLSSADVPQRRVGALWFRATVARNQAMKVAKSGETGRYALPKFWTHADELAQIGVEMGV